MKRAKWKIGIWGQFGDGGKIADGQAVRTTVITGELQNRYGRGNIGIANTNNWRRKPFLFLWECIVLVAKSEKVIILPADNGFIIFVPMLMAINILFRRILIYVVIGGFLPELLKKHRHYIHLVKKFNALFVQTNNLKRDLETLGIANIFILTNPKRLNTRKNSDMVFNNNQDIRVCVFSRINKEKGIEDAIEAVKLANRELQEERIKLDIFGLLPDNYKDRFCQLLNENKGLITYQGIVDFDKTVETLKNYFALLFPTYYYGEGLPGNVVDAYNAGLPIIATDWLYNHEVIENGRNGILVPIQNPKELCNALLMLYRNRALAYQIALNNLNDAKRYQPDQVLHEFYAFLDRNSNKECSNIF
jgi:glycosyltransferase involved in cell wall biosynthesis